MKEPFPRWWCPPLWWRGPPCPWCPWWWGGGFSKVMTRMGPSTSLPLTDVKVVGVPMKGKILSLLSSWLPGLMSGNPSASLKRLEISTAFSLNRLARQGPFFLVVTNAFLPATAWPSRGLMEGVLFETTTRGAARTWAKKKRPLPMNKSDHWTRLKLTNASNSDNSRKIE